jgi:hypothetical protein
MAVPGVPVSKDAPKHKKFGLLEEIEHHNLVNIFPCKQADAYLLGVCC